MIIKKVLKGISIFALVAIVGSGVLAGCNNSKNSKENVSAKGEVTLLNVSYDPTRELYEGYNKAFSTYWQNKTGEKVTINQSHGGSGAQSRSVIDGLEADVVTLALAADIDALNSKKSLIDANWQSKFKENSTPYTSTIVFLVREGNPKNIKDWDDLIRQDVSVVTPNPKTSGGARWNYLAAWIYSKNKFNGDEANIKDFIKKLYSNVPVLDSGARQSTTTFTEREIGDVLITWENEAFLAKKEISNSEYEIVYPSISILAEPPVAVVDSVVDKKGTREVAEAYLNYLYSDEGQEIVAKNYYRPRSEEIAKKYINVFPEIKLGTVDELGGWSKVQKEHFNDGGIFDQIYEKK